MRDNAQNPSNLVRGSVDLVVLRALRAGGRMHGFAIARWIRAHGGDEIAFEDAALYQSLHRLARKGAVTSSWGKSENNRRARFYELTAAGRERSEADADAFRSYADAMNRLLEVDPSTVSSTSSSGGDR